MYIQEALRQINYLFTGMRSQSGLIEMATESSEAVDNLVSDDIDLSENIALNMEDNSEEGEMYFASLFNSSEEDDSLAVHVETTGNDVTSLPIFDNNYVSEVNTAPQEHLSEQASILNSSLILLDGNTIYS